eukprot:ctg_341.g100
MCPTGQRSLGVSPRQYTRRASLLNISQEAQIGIRCRLDPAFSSIHPLGRAPRHVATAAPVARPPYLPLNARTTGVVVAIDGAGADGGAGVCGASVQCAAVRGGHSRVRPVLQLPRDAGAGGEGVVRVLELVRRHLVRRVVVLGVSGARFPYRCAQRVRVHLAVVGITDHARHVQLHQRDCGWVRQDARAAGGRPGVHRARLHIALGEHRLAVVGAGVLPGVLVHGGVLGRLHLHHQPDPHLRHRDGVDGQVLAPPVRGLFGGVRAGHAAVDADSFCGFPSGTVVGAHERGGSAPAGDRFGGRAGPGGVGGDGHRIHRAVDRPLLHPAGPDVCHQAHSDYCLGERASAHCVGVVLFRSAHVDGVGTARPLLLLHRAVGYGGVCGALLCVRSVLFRRDGAADVGAGAGGVCHGCHRRNFAVALVHDGRQGCDAGIADVERACSRQRGRIAVDIGVAWQQHSQWSAAARGDRCGDHPGRAAAHRQLCATLDLGHLRGVLVAVDRATGTRSRGPYRDRRLSRGVLLAGLQRRRGRQDRLVVGLRVSDCWHGLSHHHRGQQHLELFAYRHGGRAVEPAGGARLPNRPHVGRGLRVGDLRRRAGVRQRRHQQVSVAGAHRRLGGSEHPRVAVPHPARRVPSGRGGRAGHARVAHVQVVLLSTARYQRRSGSSARPQDTASGLFAAAFRGGVLLGALHRTHLSRQTAAESGVRSGAGGYGQHKGRSGEREWYVLSDGGGCSDQRWLPLGCPSRDAQECSRRRFR